MGASKESAASRLGMFASIACAIHCALLPIALGAGAAGTFAFLRDETVEWGMVLFAAVVGAVSAWRGWRSHGNVAVVLVILVAAAALVGHGLHVFSVDDEHDHHVAWTGIVGGLALAVSMFINNRMCRTCHDCDHGAPETDAACATTCPPACGSAPATGHDHPHSH